MRILIVDDHQVVRRGIRGLLEAEHGFEVCGEAVDGIDAIAKALELKPDVVVMDVTMPRMNGLDATREILRSNEQIRIVVLSQHNIPELMRAAQNAGARGYVVKSAAARELIPALHQVFQGAQSFLHLERNETRVAAGSEAFARVNDFTSGL